MTKFDTPPLFQPRVGKKSTPLPLLSTAHLQKISTPTSILTIRSLLHTKICSGITLSPYYVCIGHNPIPMHLHCIYNNSIINNPIPICLCFGHPTSLPLMSYMWRHRPKSVLARTVFLSSSISCN